MGACALIDVADCVLVVIDVQTGFVAKLDEAQREPLLGRVAWLTAVAAGLGVPLVVTAEAPERLGPVCDAVLDAAPAGTTVHPKRAFGLAGDAAVLGAVTATGRGTAVLVGLETDVCVAQSALGVLAVGLAPVVVLDAVASPGDAHAHGLERLRGAGVPLIGAKALYYEWLRTPAAVDAFEAAHPHLASDAPVLL